MNNGHNNAGTGHKFKWVKWKWKKLKWRNGEQFTVCFSGTGNSQIGTEKARKKIELNNKFWIVSLTNGLRNNSGTIGRENKTGTDQDWKNQMKFIETRKKNFKPIPKETGLSGLEFHWKHSLNDWMNSYFRLQKKIWKYPVTKKN